MEKQKEWGFMVGMMMRPRQTITKIVEGEHYEWVMPFAVLYGIAGALMRLHDKPLDTAYSPGLVLVVAVVSGGLWGLIGLFLSGWLVAVSGRWIGGMASAETLRGAITWGRVPFLVVVLLFGIKVLIGGWQVFVVSDKTLLSDPALHWPIFCVEVGIFIFSIWSLATIVVAVSQVQGFGLAKAVGNLLLAVALILLPVMLLIWAFHGIAR